MLCYVLDEYICFQYCSFQSFDAVVDSKGTQLVKTGCTNLTVGRPAKAGVTEEYHAVKQKPTL